MKSRFLFFIALSVCTLTALVCPQAAETNEAPPFQEVYDLLRKNLAEANDTELNRAAVEGLVHQLQPYVTLVKSKDAAPPATQSTAMISQVTIYDEHFGYVRIHQVNPSLVSQLRETIEQLRQTNTLRGLALDLRFATGQDYQAAAQAAELFISASKPLLKWGDNLESSKAKTNAFTLPLVVLVNQKTAGAAEAMAGALRLANAALLIGDNTAGRAVICQDYPLQNGDLLRIASTLVRLGDGSVLPTSGLSPDIKVSVNAVDEQAFYADAYAVLPKSATNLAAQIARENQDLTRSTNTGYSRPRFNEAELVRLKKSGQNIDELEGPAFVLGTPEPRKPMLQDPVLARGLDLLKGLALVRKAP